MQQSLKKHTLHLRKGDFDYLDAFYSVSTQTASSVIRQVIATYVDRLRAEEEAAVPMEIKLNE